MFYAVKSGLWLALTGLLVWPAVPVLGQPEVELADTEISEGGEFIQLNLPQTVDLGLLIEYVSKTLDLNIIYEEQVAKQRVSIVSPARIQKGELLPLLGKALKMANLELLSTNVPGWMTIGRQVLVRLIEVKYMDAEALAKQVGAVLAGQVRITQGSGAKTRQIVSGHQLPLATSAADLILLPDPRTNKIAIIGTEEAVSRAVELIQGMDVQTNLKLRVYQFRFVEPQRIDTLVRSHIESMEPKPRYVATIDEVSRLLLATTTPEVHAQIESLTETLDVEADPNRSVLRIYKLVNTTAEEVLNTIQQLYSGKTFENGQGKLSGPLDERFTGPNIPPPALGEELPKPPAYSPSVELTAAPSEAAESFVPNVHKAIVTADENTNAIIVIAPPDVQEMYRELIEKLDKRRPQVLIEVTLVVINTSDDFSLGVELQGRDDGSDNSYLVFSSFGLSTVDPVTGITSLDPGTGFHGILLSPDVLDVVVRALASNSRSRVLSAPRVLVNDNATGSLSSVAQEPFTSINASDTVATTSFAGYASAGTTVSVTPHISEGNYLQLRYNVNLSSFRGTGTEGVPPPRQTDGINSEVTIPDGYAVVVGGLTRTISSEDVSKVPWLGDIPIIKHLFRLDTKTDRQVTVFVFIRSTILRDDRFEDLKYLSNEDLREANLPPAYPDSEPLLIR